MLEKTRGIVLHTVKYGEHSLIITLFTEKFGRQSYIVNAARSSRSKNRAGLLQPLFIVEAEVYQKKSREIQRIKEIRIVSPFTSIPFDVVKATQAILISEMLYKTIIEEEHNPSLFDFIESSLIYFDMMERGKSDFHIWFLARLTWYLGIVPDTVSQAEGWLDMKKGAIVVNEPPHPVYMTPGITASFSQLINMNIQDLQSFSISRAERNSLLARILEYYQLHFGPAISPKSSAILKEVFQ